MRWFAVLVACLLSLVLAPILSSAQGATPTPPALPEVTAPFGLGTVRLPGDETTILALFAAMPAEVAGEERTGEPSVATGRIRLSYGDAQAALEPTFLQAVDFSRSDFFPSDFTVEMFVTSSASTADYGAVGYGRDGEIVWIQAESTVGVTGAGAGTPEIALPIYTIAWGAAGSGWLFSATSFTQTGLNALVTAFVQTAGGIPATPVATPAPARPSNARSDDFQVDGFDLGGGVADGEHRSLSMGVRGAARDRGRTGAGSPRARKRGSSDATSAGSRSWPWPQASPDCLVHESKRVGVCPQTACLPLCDHPDSGSSRRTTATK